MENYKLAGEVGKIQLLTSSKNSCAKTIEKEQKYEERNGTDVKEKKRP